MTTPLAIRPLFGGAISLSLPPNFIDASDLRQIPDNQEVFLSSSSDTTAILEVLGMVDEGGAKEDLWEAAKYHFSSIAHDNASLSSTILTPGPSSAIPSQPTSFPSPHEPIPTPLPTILVGQQKVHKFSHNAQGLPRPGREGDEPDNIWIGVALFRVWLEESAPTIVDGAAAGARRSKKADLVLSVNVNLSTEGSEQERRVVEEWFPRVVASVKINDYNLFGDE